REKKMDGATILAKALKNQGIRFCFGIVGIPVSEIAISLQSEGIHFVGMRNEQAASYAASAIGFLTGHPAVCLVVSGPGLIHAFAGMANAQENCWPLIVVGGSSDEDQEGLGAFQEFPQVDAARKFAKFSARPSSIDRIPFYVEKAVRWSTYGRPGVSYIDLPGTMITGKIPESDFRLGPVCPPPPKPLACPESISQAIQLLLSAKQPLIIIGKGAAYGRAEKPINRFVTLSQIPFLPTPMGKGVISDNHAQCVAAARSKALSGADVILLLGARLNWMLHFGQPPRYRDDVRIIQVDISAEELGQNARNPILLLGDVNSVSEQLVHEWEKECSGYPRARIDDWWGELKQKVAKNEQNSKELSLLDQLPMNYYQVFGELRKHLTEDAYIVSEGANTMDIGRTMLPNALPRHRLDAGTFGTMGVGLGFAIAVAQWLSIEGIQHSKVVCVEGDSAFGFSAMEYETACRYNLPIVFIVVNNNGIYSGVDKESWVEISEDEPSLTLPPTSLSPEAHYEKFALAFGGRGYFVETPSELALALGKALSMSTNKPSIINVMIDTTAQRKGQEFFWLTKSNL
ncbi:2-hydroxyacyl-CoA lyase 1-like, partial [Oscarella lobularis]|uniref:2-hydroxyacyl-CoA lyase 1-like n=1 Tax=Oscarella lobularis TaxID=121494 RepID=UPI00331423DC